MKHFPSLPPGTLPVADLYAYADSFDAAVTAGVSTVLNDFQGGACREGGLSTRKMVERRQYRQP